jgi:hypothetical protein
LRGVEDLDNGFVDDEAGVVPLDIFGLRGEPVVVVETFKQFVAVRGEVINKFTELPFLINFLFDGGVDVKVPGPMIQGSTVCRTLCMRHHAFRR